MRNFGEILLIGGKSRWEKKYIYLLLTDLFRKVDFYSKLGKKTPHTTVEDIRS